MKEKIRIIYEAITMEIREHKLSAFIYFTLRTLVIITMILQLFNKNYENVFLCLLTLILLIVPSFIQVQFKIELPTTLEIIILLFIFCAEILGEIQEFYVIFPMWDTILHTLNGFLAAAIGFSLVDLLNSNEHIQFKLSPLFVALVAFCFSMTIGVVWEMFEFTMDSFFGLDMQKDTIVTAIHSVTLDPTGGNTPTSITGITETIVNGQVLNIDGYLDIGIIDTMNDLIVNFIGAATFSALGYVYIKNRGKKSFIDRFIPRQKDSDKDYLTIIKNKFKETYKNRE